MRAFNMSEVVVGGQETNILTRPSCGGSPDGAEPIQPDENHRLHTMRNHPYKFELTLLLQNFATPIQPLAPPSLCRSNTPRIVVYPAPAPSDTPAPPGQIPQGMKETPPKRPRAAVLRLRVTRAAFPSPPGLQTRSPLTRVRRGSRRIQGCR